MRDGKLGWYIMPVDAEDMGAVPGVRSWDSRWAVAGTPPKTTWCGMERPGGEGYHPPIPYPVRTQTYWVFFPMILE